MVNMKRFENLGFTVLKVENGNFYFLEKYGVQVNVELYEDYSMTAFYPQAKRNKLVRYKNLETFAKRFTERAVKIGASY